MGPEIVLVLAGVAGAVFFWRHIKAHRAEQAARIPHAPDLEVAMHLAYHLAKSRQQRLVDPVIMACALLQDDDIERLFERCGWSADALYDALYERRFAVDETTSRLQAGWGLTRALEDALLRATTRASAAERSAITCQDVLIELLIDPREEEGCPLKSVFDEAGVSPAGAIFALVHGIPDVDVEAPDEQSAGRYDVVLYNDDVTVMEFVVSVLRLVFELPEDQAVPVMLRAHQHGRASCGAWPAATAIRLANKARAAARERSFPLRFAVGRPAPGPEAP